MSFTSDYKNIKTSSCEKYVKIKKIQEYILDLL